MPITSGQIPVTPGSGKILDTAELTVSASTVEREIVCVGSPSTAANYAEVTASSQLQVFSPLDNLIAIDGSSAQTSGDAVLVVGGEDTGGVYNPIPLASGGGSVVVSQGTAANLNATVTPPTLTKGTQGSTGFSTQDLKDAGRTYVVLYAQLITGVTTEALATFTKNVGGTATTAQTAYTITSGKTFRIQGLYTAIKNTTTVANSCVYNVRAAASVSATSPIVVSCGCSAVGAVANQQGFAQLAIPDGMELAGNGSLQIGVSHLENVTTASISSFTLIGYEY